jgi:hypothetical protein
MFKIMTTKTFNAAVERELQRVMQGTGAAVKALLLDKQMLEAEVAALKPLADKYQQRLDRDREYQANRKRKVSK